MDDTELRGRIQHLLRRLGPLDPSAIHHALDDDEVDLDDVLAAVTGEEPGAFSPFPLRDGRFCDLDHLIDGMVLTHRLTDEERDAKVLIIDPDLEIVHLCSDDGRTFPLIDGGVATYAEGRWDRLVGPDGWLPDTPVVELHVRHGRLGLTGRDDVPEVDETVTDRLDEVLATAEDRGEDLDGVELLYEARARYPLLLSTPQAPMSELLADLGLRLTEHGIVDLDEPDDLDDLDLGLDGIDPDLDDLAPVFPLLPGRPAADLLDDADLDDVDDLDETDLNLDLDLDNLDEADLDELDVLHQVEVLDDHLRDDHGFDEDEVDAVLTLYRDVLLVSRTALRALTGLLAAALGRDDVDVDDLLGLAVPSDPDDVLAFDEVVPAALESIDLDATHAVLPDLLADTDLVDAVLDDIVGTDPLAAGCVLALADGLVADLRGRATRANAAWLRARCLELIAPDHLEAERALRAVVELDPDNASATFELARYLSLRGQAGAALNLLRRIEGPNVEGQVELLSRYTTPGPASAGRNDPCPCGSGRKHKHCCEARNGWPLQERLPWLWDKVYAYLANPAAHELVAPIVRAIDEIDGPESTTELLANNLTLFEGGLLSEFCDRRGPMLPADELELIRSWSEVRAGAYELVEIATQGRVTLLDLRTGDRVGFVDHRLAANLDVGDAFVAWVVPSPDGDAPHHSVLPLPTSHRQYLLDLLDDDPGPHDLIAWFRSLVAPPRLTTTAGDPLESITKVYAVDDVEAARGVLAAHLQAEEDDPDRLLAFEERDGQHWLRGSVQVDEPPGHLTVSTMSAVRAAWFADLIDAEVADARLVDEERHPADDPRWLMDGSPSGEGDLDEDDPAAWSAGADLLDEEDLEGVAGRPGGLDLDALEPGARAAVEEQLDAFMREHEDRWLDQEIPALGGATPRQAADDPTRRGDLDRLLREMEDLAEGWSSPGRPMDAARLRRLLGL